jgi:hypothetical protein
MAYNARINFVWFGLVAAVASVALTGCDNGTGGGGGGSGTTSSSGTAATTSSGTAATTSSGTAATTSSGTGSTGTASGGPSLCPTGYCTFGDGGYAFSYADGDAPATATGMSHATLATDGSLCISGSVMALPAAPTAADYSNDWGAGLGTNLNQMMGAATAKMAYTFTGTGVTVTTSALPACISESNVRVVLDQDGTNEVCATLTSGTEIKWSQFNTTCWTTGGVALAGPPSSQAIKVQLVTTMTACAYTDFCIDAISF